MVISNGACFSKIGPSDDEVALRGEQNSVVEEFEITGLHGYRSISLSSPYAATILIAKNGSGKTTLLGALDAFLKGQFSRLRGLVFKEIRCKLNGIKEHLVLRQEDVDNLIDTAPNSEISHYARSFEVDVPSLFKFIVEDFHSLRDDYGALNDDPVFSAIKRSSGHRQAEAVAVCEKVRSAIYSHSPRIVEILKALQAVLADTEVVYLPTFRRVELPLLSDPEEPRYIRRRRSKIRFSSSASLYAGDIQFGLSDILERLAELNQTILSESNIGYRQISANIINELIDGTFERDTFAATSLPDRDALSIFFSRLKEGGRRIGPYNDLVIPNIDKIYVDDDLGFETKKTLRYFLSKLDTVIKATRDIEERVEDFIAGCNRYLATRDDSATLPSARKVAKKSDSLDEKVLRLNRRNLRVHAESLPSGRKIPLDSLSSGEKQMISLFAKLYLYQKNKIVLIDEPELSLSIDWQRQILADVVTAPLCRQVIAITHSPFVFDNALEPFARSLKLSVDIDALSSVEDDEGDSE
ncbi:AAA family ATPase [Rhizobium hidalgonense]|uniref:AAA family ATPase n=1 Tax=Rhizobium hidalgonense TaxID=1538159 RepID=UPI0013E2F15C|nr:AAA family ATPase [Rhizobium hidalgonense]